ncbi:MAG: PhnD/SsuA/transferrin family substrate-binding protein [Pseudomonadota bacterium]
MTAALGMYDMPALQAANDRFWDLIRSNLGHGPSRLSRERDMWQVWSDPNLVLAQTCGMPYRTRLHGQVHLVGTPDYGLPDCPPGYYCSVIVARASDPRDLPALVRGTFAFNDALSQSGWAAPVTHMSALNLTLASVRETGSHAASARAVADGAADFAALDALTWLMLKRHTDLGAELRDVCSTDPTPALPYITAMGQEPARVADAVQRAITDLAHQDRKTLHIQELIPIPADFYLAVPTPPGPEAIGSKT